MRIVVAMSGGVDSSVAAALLAEAGHEVIGLSMQLYDQREGQPTFGSCCSLDDLHDARRVAAAIGIPHYIVNLERQFEDQVIRNFVDEYARGRTPIPCAHCNSELKFDALVQRAHGLGADAVATGHYARVEREAGGRYTLRRATYAPKDQSYFLFSLAAAQLPHVLFPLGSLSKPDVRAMAGARKLPVADKPDSHEICFVPDGDYAAFVARRIPTLKQPGAIVDESGRAVGRHDGIHQFTIGQRKRLRLSTSAPLYVTAIDAATNTVFVGPRGTLDRASMHVSGVSWVNGVPEAASLRAQVQIRSRHVAAAALVRPLGSGCAEVQFDEPQSSVTPGQAAVFYDGDVVLGGGWID